MYLSYKDVDIWQSPGRIYSIALFFHLQTFCQVFLLPSLVELEEYSNLATLKLGVFWEHQNLYISLVYLSILLHQLPICHSKILKNILWVHIRYASSIHFSQLGHKLKFHDLKVLILEDIKKVYYQFLLIPLLPCHPFLGSWIV